MIHLRPVSLRVFRRIVLAVCICCPLFATRGYAQSTWSNRVLVNSYATRDFSSREVSPVVATDGKGTWVTVWSSELIGTMERDDDLFFCRSDDNAATWSLPKPLNTDASEDFYTLDDHSASIAADGEGNWIVAWQRYKAGGPNRLLCSRSQDNGQTWSPPVTLYGDIWNSPKITTDGYGTWLIVCDVGISGAPAYSFRSDDNGARWYSRVEITSSGYNPSIAGDGNGRWVATWRSSSQSVWSGFSEDDGFTWSVPIKLNVYGRCRAPHVATDGRGSWMVGWREIGTEKMYVVHSSDDGVSWSQPVGGFEGAPSLLNNGMGEWLAVWAPNDDYDARLSIARSADDGVSWTLSENPDESLLPASATDSLPQLATDGNGTWVRVWHSDDSVNNTIGDDYDILCTRSTDQGVSWSDATYMNPNAPFDSGTYERSPTGVPGAADTWIVAWESDYPLDDNTIGTDSDILLAQSGDGGYTWSEAKALNFDAARDKEDDSVPRLATDGMGKWVAVWHRLMEDESGLMVLAATSVDNGRTWSSSRSVGVGKASRLVFAGGSNWIVTGGDNGVFAGAYTSDDGQTWSEFAPLVEADDVRLDASPDGVSIAVWSSEDSLDETIGSDTDILMIRSEDGGKTWSSPTALVTGAASDTADDFRPQVAYDGEGNWIAVWGSGGYMCARSTDGGKGWSEPFVLNSFSSENKIGTSIAQLVSDGRGTILVTWDVYSWSCPWGFCGWEHEGREGAMSLDGGESWTPTGRLSTDYLMLSIDQAGTWLSLSLERGKRGIGYGIDDDVFATVRTDQPTARPRELVADVNGDSSVDAIDVQLVINAVLGLSVQSASDVNLDLRIDAVDVQRVINVVLNRV